MIVTLGKKLKDLKKIIKVEGIYILFNNVEDLGDRNEVTYYLYELDLDDSTVEKIELLLSNEEYIYNNMSTLDHLELLDYLISNQDHTIIDFLEHYTN